MRNVYLMFVSWFFYYKTSGLFLLILAFITLSDWLIARQIHKSKTKNQKSKIPNILLALSVTIDLGLLAYFKYAYFFTNAVNDIFGADFRVFDIFAYVGNGFAQAGRFSVDTIVLPVGISFYIFQVISYTADVFHRRIRPWRDARSDGILPWQNTLSFRRAQDRECSENSHRRRRMCHTSARLRCRGRQCCSPDRSS